MKAISIIMPTKKPTIKSIKSTKNSINLQKIVFEVPAVSKSITSPLIWGRAPDKVIVYRSNKKNSGFKKVGEIERVTGKEDIGISAGGRYFYTFENRNLKPNTTYYYRVRGYYVYASGKDHYGPYSNAYKANTNNKTTTNTTTTIKSGSYKVTFGLHKTCEQNMSLRNEPTTYTGKLKIPQVNATYRNSSTKFKHWIIQRTNDARYRVYSNKLGKYTWYKTGDQDIGNWSYAKFVPGETTTAYNAPLRLYAVCGSTSITTTTTTTENAKKYKINYKMHSSCKDVMTLYDTTGEYIDKVKFKVPNATYNNKNYEFKYWIVQRIKDGKYYIVNKDKSSITYVTLGKPDKDWEYYPFKAGMSGNFLADGDLRLYAVCGLKPTTTTTKKTTALKTWTGYIVANNGKLKKSRTISLKSNTTLPKCNDYLERSGYTCNGWKLYRDISNKDRYFVKGKGWTGTSSKAEEFRSGQSVSSIYSNTGNGVTIYLTPIWYKR